MMNIISKNKMYSQLCFKFLSVFIIVFFPLIAFASGKDTLFGYKGLGYKITSSNMVEVIGVNINSCAGDIVIPSTVTYGGKTYTVTSIGEKGPYDVLEGYQWLCEDIVSITIPYSVEIINGHSLCYNENVRAITVDDKNPFFDSRENCNAIIRKADNTLIVGCKNTFIPNTVEVIGECAFGGSGLESIDIPNSVITIGDWAFDVCNNLTYVSLGNSIETIGEFAFVECINLQSVIIPKSVKTIGKDAFYACKGLNSIIVEEDNLIYDSRDNCNAIIKTEDNALIQGCMNTVIPNTITSIEDDAFAWQSNLKSIIIPNSVTRIGNTSFNECSGLTSITIPNSVVSIGQETFWWCEGLTEVISEIERPFDLDFNDEFEDVYWYGVNTEKIPLFVPVGTRDLYMESRGWNEFKNIIERDMEATDVKSIHQNQAESTIYNLQGQQMKKPSKGLYIKDGRKILLRK